MLHGLWLSSDDDPALRDAVCALLSAQDIPLGGFVSAPATLFDGHEARDAFLYRLSEAVFRGEPVPAALILRHLSGDATPGNILRRHLEWQTALRPYLDPVDAPEAGDGFFLLGKDLLICPLNRDGAADAMLPPGAWTDMITGEVFSGQLRRLRSPNAMPILAREGAIIPTGDPACPTLHWYQPPEHVTGLMYPEPYHLILHRDGVETCLR